MDRGTQHKKFSFRPRITTKTRKYFGHLKKSHHPFCLWGGRTGRRRRKTFTLYSMSSSSLGFMTILNKEVLDERNDWNRGRRRGNDNVSTHCSDHQMNPFIQRESHSSLQWKKNRFPRSSTSSSSHPRCRSTKNIRNLLIGLYATFLSLDKTCHANRFGSCPLPSLLSRRRRQQQQRLRCLLDPKSALFISLDSMIKIRGGGTDQNRRGLDSNDQEWRTHGGGEGRGGGKEDDFLVQHGNSFRRRRHHHLHREQMDWLDHDEADDLFSLWWRSPRSFVKDWKAKQPRPPEAFVNELLPGRQRQSSSSSLPHSSFERRRRYDRTIAYKDILSCDAKQWAMNVAVGGDSDVSNDEETRTSRNSQSEPSSDQSPYPVESHRGRLEGNIKHLSHSPVVFQYFGRSRTRGGHPTDAVHFILLGPNVDHWKAVGQTLASRGFNAIACERLDPGSLCGKDDPRDDDTPNLVLDLMEALKWKKVILVGCDNEAILAMETAMMLSPDQVVGLVMSGDLSGASQAASEARVGGLDSFLQRVLDCPYLIIWDGDEPTVVSGSSVHRALESSSTDRCVILGGGSAPHRLKPEQFAWVLTRFVEEKLAILLPKEPSIRRRRSSSVVDDDKNPMSLRWGFATELFRALRIPFGLKTVVSPEGRLLLGRAIASALFYVTAMRVIFVQYGILRSGLFAIQSRYQSIDALAKRSFQAVGAFIINFGYLPRLFTLKRANDDEEEENRRRGTIVLKNQEPEAMGTDSSTLVPGGDKEVGAGSKDSDDDSNNNNEGKRQDEGKDENLRKSPSEEKEQEQPSPRFKPFFFLDNVVT